MERGIFGIAGFLSISSELRILWSAPYLSRVSVFGRLFPMFPMFPKFRFEVHEVQLEFLNSSTISNSLSQA